tara:strand:+ start:62 stop:295 length:234 start_codon:yes stop_codon:yes gene_type:complete
MKYFLPILIFLLITLLYPDEYKQKYALYLNDGIKVIGYIIEEVPGEYTKIKVEDDIFIYRAKDILRKVKVFKTKKTI